MDYRRVMNQVVVGVAVAAVFSSVDRVHSGLLA
jgi:hypothetical protein